MLVSHCRFMRPERWSEDYVHARATASGTFPTSARVSSAWNQPFLRSYLGSLLTLSIRESVSCSSSSQRQPQIAESGITHLLLQHAPARQQGIEPLFVRIPASTLRCGHGWHLLLRIIAYFHP